MIRRLLVRGLIVGALAGVLAFVVAYLFGEPQLQRAIDFEDAAGPALVSRGVQRSIGLLTGTVVMGAALGGFFALVFAWAYGRVGTFGARALAALLGAGAFLTITLVPFTKYPANPPGVGDPDTIDTRTALFVAMIVISLLAAVAAWRIRRQLLDRFGSWNASLLAIGGLHRRDRGRAAHPARRPRDAERLPGRRPVPLPARVARHQPHPLDRDRPGVRRGGRAGARAVARGVSRRGPGGRTDGLDLAS